MTKQTLVLLVLAAGAPLLAQAPGLTVATSSGETSLTIYGILDAGVANIQHAQDFSSDFVVGTWPYINAKAPNASATGVMNGGISQTRWGLRGQLGLTEGWKAVFNLESAINLQNGNLSNSGLQYNVSTGPQTSADTSLDGGYLFDRNANFGISSDTYGTLTLGRHTSLMLDAIPAWDALQGSQMFTPIGFSGSFGGGGATDNSRVDSSLKYTVKIGDFHLGGLYKFGGVSGNATARNVSEAFLSWEPGDFGAFVSYQTAIDMTSVGNPAGTVNGAVLADTPAQLAGVKNGTAAYQPIGTVTATFYDTHAIMAGARYKFGALLFTAGYEREAFTNPSNAAHDATFTSIYSIPIGTMVSNGAIAPAINVSPYTIGGAEMEKVLNVYWGGVRYDFTKQFSAAVGYYHVSQNDFSNGTGIAGDLSGTQSFKSFLLDYNWTKAFDVYLGYMQSSGTGGMVAGYLNTSNRATGLGARFKF